MNEGVTIGFLLIFLLLAGIGLVLFKEARTHRFWRQLVAENNVDAIRGILEGEIARWRTQRPPKDVSAAVWAGVQGMELLDANARFVHLNTSAEPEFRSQEGKRTQIASSLDTAFATAARLVEMVFYDVPDYRPDVVRVDVFTTFRSEAGAAEPRPILSMTADREDAMGLDWNLAPRTLATHFAATYQAAPNGEPLPIALPPVDPELAALSLATAPQENEPDEAPEAR